MLRFLIINDFNDINDAVIRHFSLDKGHFMAKSLAKLGYDVYFMTTKNDYVSNNINYIQLNNIRGDFLDTVDYVLIVREPLFINIVTAVPGIKEKITVSKSERQKPKFIVKSDSPIWYKNKRFMKTMRGIFNIGTGKHDVSKWIIDHVDYICAQNTDFERVGIRNGLPKESILLSNMSVENKDVDPSSLKNPYDIEHTYCVRTAAALKEGMGLLPYYYFKNPNERHLLNQKKYNIVYTGRIKTDGGKILYNMRNIMNILGDEYELHIFPGSFIIPLDNGLTTNHSSKNSNSLELLRNAIFPDSKNIIVHYPYQHHDKYKYLHYADCGIDFSDARPEKTTALAGHAKILEYCESGLPIVCEENIQNLFLVKNGQNDIVLPYMASDEEYADAIRKIVQTPINRKYCRLITVQNENWDRRTMELLKQLGI